MKLLSAFRYRRWVLAGMVVAALTCGARQSLFFSAVSADPTSNTPAAAPPAAVDPDAAPTGMVTTEIDKDTGKPVVTTPSGLKYVDLTVGTGPALKTGDHILVNYEGKLVDGRKFDSSYDRGQPFDLVLGVSQVIAGWTEGLSTMHVGGIRKLIIPPQLGYGLEGAGDVIPPNATLIFKVEVLKVLPN
jgi:peptidylprolyl isomerase